MANENEKTLTNTTASQAKENVSDLKIWGDGDTFKLICKASSKNEGWMKSTKAMEIIGVGCVVQVTTQQSTKNGSIVHEHDEQGIQKGPSFNKPAFSHSVAEALTYVPGVKIEEIKDKQGNVTGRKLVPIG